MNFNLLASILRTVVPVTVGALLTLTGAVGISASSAQAATLVTALVTAAYYLVFRLAEQAAAKLRWEPLRMLSGVLLGWARPPQYNDQTEPAETIQVHLDTEGFGTDLHEAIRRNLRTERR